MVNSLGFCFHFTPNGILDRDDDDGDGVFDVLPQVDICDAKSAAGNMSHNWIDNFLASTDSNRIGRRVPTHDSHDDNRGTLQIIAH